MELTIKRFEELSIHELYEILRVRAEVFVVEQNCSYQDLDEKGKQAYHVYLTENNRIKAYLRLLDEGVSFEEASIGRVLTTERGKGYANIILEKAIEITKEQYASGKIRIEAQTYAKNMYEKFGFKQTSEEFLEDGIPHIQMLLE